MSIFRTVSFTVEALESRILLSATPVDSPVSGETEDVENAAPAIWEVGELGQVGAEAGLFEEETVSEEIYESAAPVDSADEADLAAQSTTTSYDDGETEGGSIFKTGFSVIETDATHTFRSTTGGIFFSGPGAIDGTAPESTRENVNLLSAGEVSVLGPVGGASPLHNLTVEATANIVFGESINLTGDLIITGKGDVSNVVFGGSVNVAGDVIIERGAQVSFDRNVTVQGNLVIGDDERPEHIGGVAFGSGSVVNVGGAISIHTAGTVDFDNRVGVSLKPSSVTIGAGESINVGQTLRAGVVDLTASNVTLAQTLGVDGADPDQVSLRVTASNLLSVKSNLEIGGGDAILTANRVSFAGEQGSIRSLGSPSSLTIRPFDPARPIGIGNPSGGDFSRLQISHVELNAINAGFKELVIGDLENGSGELKIGNIGLAQPTDIAQIQNTATFVGGSVLVEDRVDIDHASDYLRLVARTGDVVIDGAINQSVAERNAWVRLEAARDIVVNRPVFALDRISLTAGYDGGSGDVLIQSTGGNSGKLTTTSDSAAGRQIEISAGEGGGDLTLAGVPDEAILSVAGSGGAMVLRAPGGGIELTGGLIRAEVLAMQASGDILMPAPDIQRIGNVVVDGATLASGVDLAVDGIEITGPGSLEFVALRELEIDRIRTDGGDVFIANLPESGDDLLLGQIDAGGGDIRLTADGAIVDNLAGAGLVNLTTTGQATLIARHGIGGTGDADLDTDLGRLSASNAETGGVFIHDRTELEIVEILEARGDDGSISVTVDSGEFRVNAPVNAHGAGNILLDAGDGALVVQNAVSSAAGHVTLKAADDLDLNEEGVVTTAGEGSVFLQSNGGAIVMDGASEVSVAEANLRVESHGDVVLGNLAAERVSVVSESGSILNAADSTKNVTADELRLEAGRAIGESARHLSIAVDRLSAFAGGADGAENGLYLTQSSGPVTVTNISPVEVTAYSADGSLETVSDAADLHHLATGGDGNIVLIAADGSIVLDTQVLADGEGNVRIEAGADLSVLSDLLSETGSITLIAEEALSLAPDVTVSTGLAGTILARANGGDLTMDPSAEIRAVGAAIHLSATESVILDHVEGEDVSVKAEDGSILSALDSSMNLTATNLRLEAEGAVGAALHPILTTAALISVHARGQAGKGIYLRDTTSVTVGAVAFAGQQVNADGSTAAFTEDSQAGLHAGNGGDLRLTAETGNLTLAGGGDDGRAVSVDGGGDIELRAPGGALIADADTEIRSDEGAITLAANQNIHLAHVSSNSGDLFVMSDDGAIVNGLPDGGVNLATTATAHLKAADGIGASGAEALVTEVGAVTAQNLESGLIVIRQQDDLVVSGDATMTVGGIHNAALDGSVLVVTEDGALRVDGAVVAAAGGKILLQAEGIDSDLSIGAPVTAENGPISLVAERNVGIETSIVTGDGGTVDVFAASGSITMSTDATVDATDSDVRLFGEEAVIVTGVRAGSGNVHVTSVTGSILDAGNEHASDLFGSSLRLTAFGSIGTPAAPLDTDVNTIAAVASNGGIYLLEKSDVSIDTVPVVMVDRVSVENTTSPIADSEPVSDLVAESDGDISLVSETGSIVIEDGEVADNTAVRSAGGDIVLQAENEILQNTGIATIGDGDISLVAVTGAITMMDGVETTAESGGIAYTGGGDVLLSRIAAETGDLSVVSGDRIVDNTANQTPNLVTTGHASLEAVHGIGDVGTAAIDTDVGSISAVNETSGRIVIDEVDGLTLAQSGIETRGGDGDIIITVKAGDLIIESPVSGYGRANILLHTLAAGTRVESSAAISSGSGNVTLSAPDSIHFESGASLYSGAGGTVTFRAATGSIDLSDGVLVDGGSGDVRMEAEVDVRLGGIATDGNVFIQAATGSILNNGDALVNITGDGVRLEAAVGIGLQGAAANPVTTDAGVLAARATSGGINLLESTAVSVDNVSVLTRSVNPDATVTQETEAALSDLVTTGGNGAIVLRTLDGGITLNDGSAPADNTAVTTHGTGNILLQASGDGADVTVNARVFSPAGHLSILAAGSVTVAPGLEIFTGADATLTIEAEAGSIIMDDTTRFYTNTGDIRLVAGTDVLIGGLSTDGNIAIIAEEGSILTQGDTYVDVNATELLLNAGDGVGALGQGNTNLIVTAIDRLTARAGSGGVNVWEANNLTVGDVTVTVAKVGSDGLVTETVEGTQSDVRTTAGDGSIVLRLDRGSFLLESGTASNDGFAIAAHGSGNVLVEATGAFSDIFADGGISSDTGHISLSSTLEIRFADGADIRTGGSGSIDLRSVNGFLVMADNSLFSSETGDIRLMAPADIFVGGIRTGGNVSIISQFASILDNGDTYVDVKASGLRLVAHTDIGILVPVGVGSGPNPLDTSVSVLSARTTAGDINILEANSVRVDDVSVSINRVGADGTTSPVADEVQSALRTHGGNGSIVLRSAGGDITLNKGSSENGAAISAHGHGNILIESFGTETDVTANADVRTATGHVTMAATGSVAFDGADVITAGSGTIHVSALHGDVTQAGDSKLMAEGADIRIVAGENIYVDRITTDTRVSLIAEAGSILNNRAPLGDENVIADQLRLVAGTGIGEPEKHLETSVNTVAARAASGGVFLLEVDTLVVDDTAASVRTVNFDNTLTEVADETLSDVITISGDGSIVLRTLGGSITLNDGSAPSDDLSVSAHGDGNILIQAMAAGSDIMVHADIHGGAGNITLQAERDITLDSEVNIATSGAGTISLDAVEGVLTMHGSANVTAADGALRLAAAGDVLVGNLTGADVSILSRDGSIVNAPGSTKNVVATNLRLQADQAIGFVDRYMTTTVSHVTASAAGTNDKGIYLAEDNAITVTALSVTVEAVNSDATVTSLTDAEQAGLVTGNDGNIVLLALDGGITTSEPTNADGGGNVLLDARGDGNDLTVNADVSSDSGQITLHASGGLNVGDDARITTAAAGTISLAAGAGSIVMDGGARITAENSSLRLHAPADITVGNLEADNVSILSAGGSILSAPESAKNVTATHLRLEAGQAIGSGERHLSTAVANVAARADGNGDAGIYITEDDQVAVTTVDEITVTEFHSDTTTTDVKDAPLSDLRTGNNGNIVLVALDGEIRLEAGLSDDHAAIRADGSGSVLIDARGDGSDLQIDAHVFSETGSIALKAASDLWVAAAINITTSGGGTVSLDAVEGTLTMAGDAEIAAVDGALRLAASGDVLVGNLFSTSVSIVSGSGSVVNADGSTKNVTAANLRIEAGQAVGAVDRPLTTLVANLTVRAAGTGAHGIYINEENAVNVTTLGVTVSELTPDATMATVTDADQSGMVAGNDGHIVLVADDGDVSVEDNVTAEGAGSVLLDVRGADRNLMVDADIGGGTGHITLNAVRDIVLGAGVNILTAAPGTVSFVAESGSIIMDGGAAIVANDSSLRLQAESGITVGQLTAAQVSILSVGGSILNGDGATKNVTATNLRLEADQAIGVPQRHLTTAVANLTARANGGGDTGIYITEANDVTVTEVGVTVTEFSSDATTTELTDGLQSGLVSGNHGDIVLVALDGGVALDEEVNAAGSGNILLDARGTDGELMVGADIIGNAGSVSLASGRDARFAAEVSVAADGGTIDIESGASIVMENESRITTGGGNIRISAAEDMVTGLIEAGAGKVSLIATAGSITGNGETDQGISGEAARLVAGAAIGQPGDALNIHVATLTALSGAGGISLNSADGVIVDTVSVAVNRVEMDGEVTGIVDLEQADLVTAGSLVLTADGDVVLTDGFDENGIAISAAEHLLLDVTGNLVAHANVVSANGHVSLLAEGRIEFGSGADLRSDGGTLDLEAGGSILFADEARAMSQGGNIRLLAADDITLGGIDAGSGKVSLIATDGSILDGGDTYIDLVADEARLFAGDGIGETFAPLDIDVSVVTAHSGVGGISFRAVNDITFGAVSVTVNRVGPDFTLSEIVDLEQSGLVTEGGLALSLGGDLTLDAELIVSASLLLEVEGDLVVNHDIRSTNGNVSLVAGGLISVRNGAVVGTEGGTVDFEAGAGIGFEDASRVSSAGGDVRLQAGETITLGRIDAGTGDVSLIADEGAILDGETSGLNVIASALRLWASDAIGEPENPLDINVEVLTARAGTGGISLNEASSLRVGSVSVTVNRVGGDFNSGELHDPAQADVRTEGGLALTVGGNLILDSATEAVEAAGNIRLDADGVVTVSALISSGGNVSILAADTIDLGAEAGLSTSGGTVDFEAGGSILMANGALVSTEGGNVRFLAADDVVLGGVDAATGQVSVISVTGSILNGGDVHSGITAAAARLVAEDAIGLGGQPLDVEVGLLTAHSGSGGISLSAANGVVVDEVAVTVYRVMSDFETDEIGDSAQGGLATTGGLALGSDGNVVLNESSAVGGNVRIDVAGSLTIRADIASTGGHVSVIATETVQLESDAALTTAGGTVDLDAGGSLVFGDGAQITSAGGDIRLLAAADIALGRIDAGVGRVSLAADSGSILSGGERDIIAVAAALSAGTSVGEVGSPLDVIVDVLAVDSQTGGINVREADGLAVGAVNVSVNRIGADFEVIDSITVDLSGLVTTGNLGLISGGDVVLESEIAAHGNILLDIAGSMTANAAAGSTGGHVSLRVGDEIEFGADGRLSTSGGTVDLESGTFIHLLDTSVIETNGGNVRLVAEQDITLGSIDAGAGKVSLTTLSGSVLPGENAVLNVFAAEVRVQAATGVGEEDRPLRIEAEVLTASAQAAGVFVNVGGDTSVGAVGVIVHRVAEDFAVSEVGDEDQSGLVAIAGPIVFGADGNVRLDDRVQSAGDIRFDVGGWMRHGVAIGENAVETEGNLVVRTTTGLGTTGGGTIQVAADTLVIENRGTGSAFVTAQETITLVEADLDGAGSLFFHQQGGTLRITGPVSVTEGHLNLLVRDVLDLDAAAVSVAGDIDIVARSLAVVATPIQSEHGGIDLRVADGLALDPDSPVIASGGDVRLRTDGALTIALVKASGLVHLVAAEDITTSAPGEKEKGVDADHLRIRSGGNIGSEEAPLMADSNRLDLDADDNVYLSHAGGMNIGRFGMRIETAPGQEFVIDIEGGVVGSSGGGVVDRGEGTLVLQSSGEITIGSLLRSERGSIRIEAVRTLSGFDSDTARIEAPEGRVTLVADVGIGSVTGGPIHFNAPYIEASTRSGPIQLNALGSTTVAGMGIIAARGNAPVTFTQQHGNLTLQSSIRHLGGGSIFVDSLAGSILMERHARMTTISGGLSVKALSDVVVSRIESGRGLIHLESTTGSIKRLSGFSSANILATFAPEIRVASIADLRVSADRVFVNDSEIFRRSASSINLYLVF